MMRFCNICGKPFKITDEELHNSSSKGYSLPWICSPCKKQRKDPYRGWESTFGACGSKKGRHHRVAYPVHTVGGFR